jgi:hypothetical protein
LLKLILKLVLVALIANATWRLGSAYVAFYRFKDAVAETAQFGNQRSRAELLQRVFELASQFDIPLAIDAVSIRRDDLNHTIIDGSYTQPVDVLPGYRYMCPFSWHVDVFTVGPSKPEPPGALLSPVARGERGLASV